MDSQTTPFLDNRSSNEDNDDNDSDLDSSLSLKHQPSNRHTLSFLFHPIIYLFAIWGFISLSFGIIQTVFPDSSSSTKTLDVYRPSTLAPGLTSCLCGANPTEAISLNCVYDTLSSAWLPPYCRDAELTAEFERSGPGPNGEWTYYADPDGKHIISVEQVAALGGTAHPFFYASRRYHIAHCLFYWQKYWRMRDTGVVMEEMYDSLRHAKHCGRLVLNKPPEVEVLIEVPVVMNGSGLLIGGEDVGHGHEHGHH
ncbi:hypothetical protein QBC38DRAFT_516497 [Podospora fimiseda]|uniref:Uncharacterized protein n=1 Tax=Podospora fimiseda TaxID=252190 RepID=A0AAN7BHS1_9PEZI|nr:hypothetical protein QBC38DRAFT_516497 [Podospora fimiseda]